MPESTHDPIRNILLGQIPAPGELPAYRDAVNRLLHHNAARLRRERMLAFAAWIFCAALATLWIWTTPLVPGFSRAPFLACIFMIIGAVEVLKHRINTARVHLLAELKQLQVQLFDLEQRLPAAPASDR